MNRKATKSLQAVLLASALAFASPAFAAGITIVLGSEPTTLDPQLTEDGSERAVSDNVYETLMARTPKGELVAGLAAEAPTQVDPKTWRFKLRPGISFTDGEPLNAEAVAFSVKRIIDPAYNSSQISFFSTITGATPVDDLTVDITTSGPDPILPARMYWMKIVAPQAAASPDFASHPVGTGPYKFVSWESGTSLKLVRNDAYWGEKPSIDEVNFRYVGDTGTQLAGLMAGEFDLMTRLPPEFLEQVPKSKAVQGLEQPTIVLSAVSGITQDVRVRQALNYALDKEGLVEGLFGEHASVSQAQLLAPSYFGYDTSVTAYPYDLEKAKALLAEAGVTGKTIELVGSNDHWLKDREINEAVAGMWTAAGLDVKLTVTPFSEYAPKVYKRDQRPDALFVSNSNELMDADRPFSAYYSAGGPGSSNTDAEMQALIEAARVETDVAKRKDLYSKVIARSKDQAYLAWLFVMDDLYGTSERLNWEPRVDAKLLVKEMSVAE